jgi:hypothetical protein
VGGKVPILLLLFTFININCLFKDPCPICMKFIFSLLALKSPFCNPFSSQATRLCLERSLKCSLSTLLSSLEQLRSVFFLSFPFTPSIRLTMGTVNYFSTPSLESSEHKNSVMLYLIFDPFSSSSSSSKSDAIK